MQVETRPPFFAFSFWLFATVSLLSIGCERKPTTITGNITLDHKRPTITSNMRGTIAFQPQNGQGAIATGLLSSTGVYEVSAGSSSEVAPGKYDVAISIVKLVAKSEAGEQGAKRITAAKYNSAQTSGLTANVQSGPNVFDFDVSSSEESSDAPADSQSQADISNNNKSAVETGAKP